MAAREADAIVPVISFSEAANKEWRLQLPQIVSSVVGRAPDFVLCTHMDKVRRGLYAAPSRVHFNRFG